MSHARRWARMGARLALLGVCLGCACEPDEPTRRGPVEASPNATLIPAPLLSGQSLVPGPESTVAPLSTSTNLRDAFQAPSGDEQFTSVPVALPLHAEPPADGPQARIGVAVTLGASLDWSSGVTALRFASLDPESALAVNESLKPRLRIELRALGRMSLELETQAFPLPRGTEFLARFDRLGHFLVWPDQKRYRTIGRGALRTLLSERRPDVAPLLQGELNLGPPGKRLGMVTRRHELKSSRGVINLEQVFIEGSQLGGPLLCRWIIELISLRTSNDSCERNWVPVWASIREAGGGELTFAATELSKNVEGYKRVYVPPRNATFVKRGLPALTASFLEKSSIAALRNGQSGANLGANNHTPSGAFLLLNGTRIAFVPPHTESIVGPFVMGEYRLGYRDFFGKELKPEMPVRIPTQFSVGASEDAGLPQP